VGIAVAYWFWSGEGLRLPCIFYTAPVAEASNFVWLEPEMGEKLFEMRKRIGE